MDDNLLANLQTKERSVNFSKIELERLQTLLTKYKNILFCKKTDGVSTKQKESAWSKIECEFNALADTPRTVKQLKYKFENLKRTGKKGASKERQEMRRTGGGPLPTPPSGLSDATDWLRGIIPSSIDGNVAIYDDDVINQKPTVFSAKKPEHIIEVIEGNMAEMSHLPKKPHPEKIIIEVAEDYITEEAHLQNKIPDNEKKTNEASATNEKWDFDPSTPYSSLKRPISSPLKSRAKKRRTAETLNQTNVVRQLLREKKLSVMDNLQEPELQKIKESIRHAQELHDQKLRHNEERHKLEMQKLELDIRILKKSDELL